MTPYHLFKPPQTALNNREMEVAGLIADGRTTNEVAATLGIAASTVRLYVSRACEKAGVADRWALVRWVREQRRAA